MSKSIVSFSEIIICLCLANKVCLSEGENVCEHVCVAGCGYVGCVLTHITILLTVQQKLN